MRKSVFQFCMISICMMLPVMSYATDFGIIPEAKSPKTVGNDVECIRTGKGENCKGKTVRDRYNNQSKKYDEVGDTGASFSTGVFSWDTILEYIVYIVKFLSEVGLVVGAGMIIFSGYKYATAVFEDKTPKMEMVTNAIQGILVIVFSYAIIKALTAAFL